MPRVRFEPTIPAFERTETVHALDRAATVIGSAPYDHSKTLVCREGYHVTFSATIPLKKMDRQVVTNTGSSAEREGDVVGVITWEIYPWPHINKQPKHKLPHRIRGAHSSGYNEF
jgi:hypothetical protein